MKSATLLNLVIVLVLASFLTASAQPPEPDYRPGRTDDMPAAESWRDPVAGPFVQADAAPTNTAIDLGQPGLSFRYVQTFGETERPYLDDTDHFYDVSGIGVDGANVWIADSWGNRILKFDADGNVLQQIGKAGVIDATGVSLDFVSDVAVDQSGNIWVVDAGAKHIAKYDAAGNHVGELGKVWEGGSTNDQFNDPLSLAFDSVGNIYVSDSGIWGDYGNHRVQVFDSTGVHRATIGATGVAGSDNAHLHSPRRIAVYADRLYIADAGNQRVQIFDVSNPSSPAYIATLGDSGVSGSDNNHFDYPEGVGVDADFIYVADSNNHRVQIFDRNTRTYVATLGAGVWGTDNNHFNYPSDAVVDSSGRIYVADNYNKRVQQYNSSRVYLRTYGTTGVAYVTDGYHYYNPKGVAVAGDGSIYIAEERGHRLVKLNAAGAPQWTVGEAGQNGEDNEHFFGPSDVATDSAGRAYVTESWGNNRVQIFSSDGAYYATLGTGYGTGNYEFNSPEGIAVGSAGIFVADTGNHRIQVYDNNRQYLGTIGVTSVSGSDNAHFDSPQDVAVDAAGSVYVADQNNHRVQKCSGADTTWTCTTFAGVTGISGDDFSHLRYPTAVAVDAQGRVYVASGWGERVQVFNAAGAYLTTVGGNWSNRNGQLRNAEGLAIDGVGNLYVAEKSNNQRIQRFAPGVPGWRQMNINGFGDRWATWISSLLPFQGSLYAAGYPARIWRMTAAGAWSQVNTDGFGDTTNNEIDALAEFNGHLYAATYTLICDNPDCSINHTNGPQIWRSSDGSTWEDVTPAEGIGSGYRYVPVFAVFSGHLYAGVGHGDGGQGAEIWRTADGLTWTRVVENGFADDIYNSDVLSLTVYNNSLYAGTRHGDWYDDDHTNGALGGEVWRSDDGTTWTRVNAPGFGDLQAHRVESLLVFQNGIYAYVSHVGGTTAGADVWRCTKTICADQADWTRVVDNGFGVPQNQYLYAGAVSGGYLYAAASNATTGLQLWRTANGSDWEKATPYDGLGNSNNYYISNNAMTVFNDRLALGISNYINGIGVWQKTLTADFTATPTRGAPPLTVQFTNTSTGDFTTSQWDFGDGQTSTELNPTHVYTQVGAYEVTLTVGDGTDTSTATKPGYIVAAYADGIMVDGACTLVNAITAANTDTDTGGCTGGSGADTIVLTVDVILTDIDNSTLGATGLPVVTSEITIAGNDHTISRSSADEFRILAVDGAGNLTLQSTTISGGAAQISGTTDEMSGGGILNAGTLAVQDCTISGNNASGSARGGGIYNLGGTLTVQNSTVSGNGALVGGGISNWEGTAMAMNSTIAGNGADVGGGIFNWEGPLTVQNSTISGNGGTGISFISVPTVTVQNSTITGNSGGGISVWGKLAVQNSIVAAQTNGVDCDLATAGTVVSEGYNIESGTTCGFTGAGDQQNTDPLLGALANNGGPTQTMALHAGSPAIDSIAAGTNGCVAGTSPDQRGATRASGADGSGTACDIGAYEFETLDIALDGAIGTLGDEVTLSWNPLTVSRVQVWRSNSPFSGFTLLRDEVTTTSVEVSIDPNTNYYYEIRALGAFGGDPLAVSATIGVFSFGLAPGVQ